MQHLNITQYNFFKRLSTLDYVEKIELYGSRARGDNFERSDIDLAIYCPKATDRQWYDLLDIIDEADTLLHIDCIRLDNLDKKDNLYNHIKRDGVTLFSRN